MLSDQFITVCHYDVDLMSPQLHFWADQLGSRKHELLRKIDCEREMHPRVMNLSPAADTTNFKAERIAKYYAHRYRDDHGDPLGTQAHQRNSAAKACASCAGKRSICNMLCFASRQLP